MTISPTSLVPIPVPGGGGKGLWASEPVFPLDEAARLLGTTKDALKHLRTRHPNVRKVVDTVSTTSRGGPQKTACLTHYGLFRHARFIKTPQATAFIFGYPEFVRALGLRKIRTPLGVDVAELYRTAMSLIPIPVPV